MPENYNVPERLSFGVYVSADMIGYHFSGWALRLLDFV